MYNRQIWTRFEFSLIIKSWRGLALTHRGFEAIQARSWNKSPRRVPSCCSLCLREFNGFAISHPEQLIAKPTTLLSHSCYGGSRSRLLLSFVPCDEQMFDRSENNGYTLQRRLLSFPNETLEQNASGKPQGYALARELRGSRKINFNTISVSRKKSAKTKFFIVKIKICNYVNYLPP